MSVTLCFVYKLTFALGIKKIVFTFVNKISKLPNKNNRICDTRPEEEILQLLLGSFEIFEALETTYLKMTELLFEHHSTSSLRGGLLTAMAREKSDGTACTAATMADNCKKFGKMLDVAKDTDGPETVPGFPNIKTWGDVVRVD